MDAGLVDGSALHVELSDPVTKPEKKTDGAGSETEGVKGKTVR